MKQATHSRRSSRRGSPSTKAGEYVREEIRDIRAGKHGARSAKQAIAIGLSKARRAGVPLAPPKPGQAPADVIRKARHELAKGRHPGGQISARRSRATVAALKRESRGAVSKTALSSQARAAARKRSPAERSASARKAARTRTAKRA